MGPKTDVVALLADLEAAPWNHDFYDTLRRLECAFPERPRWGLSRVPAEDAIRLGQEPSLTFAPAPLAALIPADDTRPPVLLVHVFGLLGPNGPLPIHLTEYIRERQRHAQDRATARFLDVLQHRFLSLFYRAWAQAQPHVNHDRRDDDRFRVYVGAFAGIAPEFLRRRDSVDDMAKLFHAGALLRPARNVEGLQSILRHFFRVPVRVIEFVGHWMALGDRERTKLGAAGASLGAGAVLGEAVWDRQHKFRLEIGPLTRDRYEALLPGGRDLQTLVDWVRMYLCFELEWDVRLVLSRAEVPPLALGRSGRLGWTTWLGRRPDRDADDLCLNAEAFHTRAGVRAA